MRLKKSSCLTGRQSISTTEAWIASRQARSRWSGGRASVVHCWTVVTAGQGAGLDMPQFSASMSAGRASSNPQGASAAARRQQWHATPDRLARNGGACAARPAKLHDCILRDVNHANGDCPMRFTAPHADAHLLDGPHSRPGRGRCALKGAACSASPDPASPGVAAEATPRQAIICGHCRRCSTSRSVTTRRRSWWA